MVASWPRRLREELRLREWSYPDLAQRAGVPHHSVKKYAGGKVENPRHDTLQRIAAALGLEYTWLLTGTGGKYVTERKRTGSDMLDEGLLSEIIKVIEEQCERSGQRPAPQLYAKLVCFCYMQLVGGPSVVDPDSIIRAFKLVS